MEAEPPGPLPQLAPCISLSVHQPISIYSSRLWPGNIRTRPGGIDRSETVFHIEQNALSSVNVSWSNWSAELAL